MVSILDPHLTTHYSNLGVRLRWVYELGPPTLIASVVRGLIDLFDVENNSSLIPRASGLSLIERSIVWLTHYSPVTMDKYLFSRVGWVFVPTFLNALIGLCAILQHDKDFIESSIKDSEVVQVRTRIRQTRSCRVIFSVYSYRKLNFWKNLHWQHFVDGGYYIVGWGHHNMWGCPGWINVSSIRCW